MRLLKDERGQVLLIVALMASILILAAALAVDSGNAFVTKARLTKAVDAACLAGMKNLSQGHSTASTIATHIFNANFGNGAPTPTITFPTDAYGDQQVQVTASTSVPTTLAQIRFPFWTVADTAVATRGKLVMSLVLDNTGSLNSNGGATAVKNAVPTFVNYFDNISDHVSLITFGKDVSGVDYTQSTVNFAMATNFQSTIDSDVSGLKAGGGTFGTGGTYVAGYGPPMALADNQIASVPIVSGSNTVRVMVYFTDGLMNAVQDDFTCYYTDSKGTKQSTTVKVNYGGVDPAQGNHVYTFQATDGTDWCGSDGCQSGSTIGIAYKAPTSSTTNYCLNSSLNKITTFPSQQYGTQRTISEQNVVNESKYRAIQEANAMRAESPGVYVFTIGLGTGVDATTQTFLKQVANDPGSPTYNANLPVGQFFYISDCSTGDCTTQLKTAFQIIASKILLRLTQ